jgi:glycerol uptake facilitator-like aquaporin
MPGISSSDSAPKTPPPAGGPYTGASLNPARTIGPACVFACNVGVSFLYIFAEFFGAALAAGLAIFMYGRAPVGRAAPNRG